MKFAHVATSPRLQRVAALLADGCERTTMEIVLGAQVCAVNSIVSELRANGIDILCRRVGDVWVYWRPAPVGAEAPPTKSAQQPWIAAPQTLDDPVGGASAPMPAPAPAPAP